MLAKVAGDSRFKVGEGDKTWNELEFVQPDSIQLGGGLATDAQGKIYVDFSQMPTDKFEKLVQSIRVPIWLEKNTTFYVATTGSDVLDTGRGLSADKPFKTITTTLQYICSTYNIGKYTCSIQLSDGDYTQAESIVFPPSYQVTTGHITLLGNAQDASKVVIPSIKLNFSALYNMSNLTIKPTYTESNLWIGLYLTDGKMNITHLIFDYSQLELTKVGVALIVGHSFVQFTSSTSLAISTDIIVKCNKTQYTRFSSLYQIGTNGQITHLSNLRITGKCKVGQVFYVSGGMLGFTSTSTQVNPVKPQILVDDEQISGKKYTATNLGVISVGGAGPDFIPATEDGSLTGYSVLS